MTTTPPPGPIRPLEGFGIDPRIGAATLRAPAASIVDFHPQAILKFHRTISLVYRARHGTPVNLIYVALLDSIQTIFAHKLNVF